MNNVIENTKKFIDKEKQNKKSLLFWLPFTILALVSLVLFVIFKVNIMGWLLAIFLFVVTFIFRGKIFLFSLSIQVITLCIFVVLVSSIFIFTREKDNNELVSKVPLRDIAYSNTYDLPLNKGTYKVNVSTNKTDNKYVLGIEIYANTSIVPSDFIYIESEAKSYVREGITILELDQLEVFITSTDTKLDYYSHGPLSIKLDYSDGTTQIGEMFPSTFEFTFNSYDNLLNFINKYNKLEVYRYNIGEVGINDFISVRESDGTYNGSYGYNSEKAYKLHPVLLEVPINWNDLKTEIESK